MNQLLCLAGPSLCALLLGAAVPAADLFVDANGTPGTYATVQAAILAAQPGDRILVLPGSYPAFSITKAIHIVGVGTEPSSVVVGGVHLGLGFPNQNYHVSLSRLRIDAGPTSPTAVSGQELGVGRIEFDSVEVEGGFRLLSGEPGFVLSFANCEVRGDIGQGYDGGTCHLAAPAPSYFSITRSRFQGARGNLFAAQAPMAGLLLDGGVTVQIEQCSIDGGDGGVAQAGAPGLDVRSAQVRSLGTSTVVTGGDGGVGAAGGPGVRTTSTVLRGTVSVAGGVGTPSGPTVTGGGALLQATGVRPELSFHVDQSAIGPVMAAAGSQLDWQLDAGNNPSVVLMSLAIGGPLPPPLDQLAIDPGFAMLLPADATFVVPPLGAVIGLPLFFQGIAFDVSSGAYRATAVDAIHLDG